MMFTLQEEYPFDQPTDGLVLFLWQEKTLARELKDLNFSIGGQISNLIESEDFKAKKHETLMLYPKGLEAKRIMLVGLGEKKSFTSRDWQRTAGLMAAKFQQAKIDNFSVYLPNDLKKKLGVENASKLLAKGVLLGTYQFSKYKTDEQAHLPELKEITIGNFSATEIKKAMGWVQEGEILGNAANFTRDYGNLPPNDATPTVLVSAARDLARENKNLSVKILHKEDMEKLGMGALLGVSKGSRQLPAFIILEWKGNPKKKDWLGLVGKAITFDSGGISIKPSNKMDEMKFDMSGGGTVLGAMKAIAELGLKYNVVGLVPATENLPGGDAYKPGDILTSLSRKTIEVLNTDAEGRLILADALAYAARYKPKAVIDLATLTGACVVALGDHATAVMGNNDKVINKVKKSAEKAEEQVWQLPLWSEHEERMKSDVADLRNTSKGSGAGTTTAGAFLKQFVDYPWAHMDIAGTAWQTSPKPWMRAGATGSGVHTLVEFVKTYK